MAAFRSRSSARTGTRGPSGNAGGAAWPSSEGVQGCNTAIPRTLQIEFSTSVRHKGCLIHTWALPVSSRTSCCRVPLFSTFLAAAMQSALRRATQLVSLQQFGAQGPAGCALQQSSSFSSLVMGSWWRSAPTEAAVPAAALGWQQLAGLLPSSLADAQLLAAPKKKVCLPDHVCLDAHDILSYRGSCVFPGCFIGKLGARLSTQGAGSPALHRWHLAVHAGLVCTSVPVRPRCLLTSGFVTDCRFRHTGGAIATPPSTSVLCRCEQHLDSHVIARACCCTARCGDQTLNGCTHCLHEACMCGHAPPSHMHAS